MTTQCGSCHQGGSVDYSKPSRIIVIAPNGKMDPKFWNQTDINLYEQRWGHATGHWLLWKNGLDGGPTVHGNYPCIPGFVDIIIF